MARTLIIASQKGGVGKTTTALNLSYTLAQLGNRVLLVDSDPQGGIAIASNLRRKTSQGLVHLLRGDVAPDDVIIPTRDGRLSVLGSGVEEPEDTTLLEESSRNGALEAIVRDTAGDYDYVFLDTPAGVGGIVEALMGVSDGVILMMRCRTLLLKTLPIFLKLIRRVRSTRNPRLRLEGALVTMWHDGDPLEKEILSELTARVPEALFFRTVIPYDSRFERASVKGIPVILLPGGTDAGKPYLELAMELKEREVLRNVEIEADDHVEGIF